jgi:hypothetical protein
VESCTAVVERPDGTLEIVRWTDLSRDTPPEEEELPFEASEPTPIGAVAA